MRGGCVVGVVDSCHRGSIAGFTFWVCVLELVLGALVLFVVYCLAGC